MVKRLPDDSMTAALMHGGRQFFGWGTDRYMLADLYDAINVNTTATGNWKKGKQPDIPAWPRPSTGVSEEKQGKKKVSVRDVFNRFQARKG